MKYDIGVVVGRFQVPEFHEGHRHLLDLVYKSHKAMLVFIGVSPAHGTIEDPLDYSLRQQMISDLYPEAVVLMITDRPKDEEWSETLDFMIEGAFPNRKPLLYGGRDSFLKHYTGRHETKTVKAMQNFSGTEVRNGIDAKNANADFRRGVIYSLRYLYPKVFPTVDVAVTTRDKYVLLGRKRSIDGLIFPGGFVSPQDESFEHAAVRELREETGLTLQSGLGSLRYLMTTRIDDWRYRNRRDKIITTFYQADFFADVPKAGDDLDEVTWRLIDDSVLAEVAVHHRPLFLKLMEVS